jgi:hypothetical protein
VLFVGNLIPSKTVMCVGSMSTISASRLMMNLTFRPCSLAGVMKRFPVLEAMNHARIETITSYRSSIANMRNMQTPYEIMRIGIAIENR